MALAFGCCYLFGGIKKKKGKQKANQKWRISERLHFSGSLSALFFWKPKAGCYLNFVQLFLHSQIYVSWLREIGVWLFHFLTLTLCDFRIG